MQQDRTKIINEVTELTDGNQDLNVTAGNLENYIANEKALIAHMIFDECKTELSLGNELVSLDIVLDRVKDKVDGLVAVI